MLFVKFSVLCLSCMKNHKQIIPLIESSLKYKIISNSIFDNFLTKLNRTIFLTKDDENKSNPSTDHNLTKNYCSFTPDASNTEKLELGNNKNVTSDALQDNEFNNSKVNKNLDNSELTSEKENNSNNRGNSSNERKMSYANNKPINISQAYSYRYELEPPIECCKNSCENCVWIIYADRLMEKFENGDIQAKEEIEKNITDPSMKAYLLFNLEIMAKKKKNER